MQNSKIAIEQFESASLKDNPLGDPTMRRVPVYLPPGYDDNDGSYPVVYVLAAFASRGLKLLNDMLWDENIQERMDRLIDEKIVQPMILVLPDASTRYGGSQYLNSSATGQYEDHILEIVAYIDTKFRIISDRKARAVMGHSSGGYGALTLGMKHSDIFGLVADHSGDKGFELAYQPEFGDFLRYYEGVGEQGLMELLEDPGAGLRNGAPFSVINIAAMASCYSPNPDSIFGFDLPFDLHTGRLRTDIWEKWQTHDPLSMVKQYADALRSLRLLYFDCGTRDEYNLLYGARQFAEELAASKISHIYEEFDGGHSNVSYRFDKSLKAISDEIKT